MDKLLSNVKEAQKELLKLSNEKRNLILERINKALLTNIDEIIEANKLEIVEKELVLRRKAF